jgi:hypothetical protein
MVRINAEGLFYFHVAVFAFGFLAFLAIKDLNFGNLDIPPDFSETQLALMKISCLVGIVDLLLLVIRGFTIRTPRLGPVGILAIIIMLIGLEFIIGAYAFDIIIRRGEVVIGSYSAIFIAFGSLIVVVGAFMYAYRKFSEDIQREWFIRAVREELRKPEAVKPSKIIYKCPSCATDVNVTDAKCPSCGEEFEPEEK